VLSYTVLVRRYKHEGITLPSRANSPPEFSTPAPPSHYYQDDEDYYETPSSYDNLMPPQTQHSSARSRHSWSSIDSEGAVSATWSNALRPVPAPFHNQHVPHSPQHAQLRICTGSSPAALFILAMAICNNSYIVHGSLSLQHAGPITRLLPRSCAFAALRRLSHGATTHVAFWARLLTIPGPRELSWPASERGSD
jgi:hypothetical protein